MRSPSLNETVARVACGTFSEFALLHSPFYSFESDVDTVVRIKSQDELDAFRRGLLSVGVTLVGLWEYDLDSFTLLLANETCTGALDLCFDQTGRNKYGLSATSSLSTLWARGLPFLTEVDFLLYSAVTGAVKGDAKRVTEAFELLRRSDLSDVRTHAEALFVPYTARWLLDGLSRAGSVQYAGAVRPRRQFYRRVRQVGSLFGALANSARAPRTWCVLRDDPNYCLSLRVRFAVRFRHPGIVWNTSNPRLAKSNYLWRSLSRRCVGSNTIVAM